MNKTALVIGGGIAGIQAALDLGEMGVETYLLDKAPSVGGRMAQLDKTFPTNDCAMCILSPKLVEVGSHPHIHILTNSEVMDVSGAPPAFTVKVLKKPRYIKEDICTGCGVCTTKCPTKIPDPYNKGLSDIKCISIPFPQAIPAIPIIDKDSCRYFKTGKCRVCEKFCEMKAIDFDQKDQIVELEVGSIIIASGTKEFDGTLKGELGYKIYPNVISSIEYERILSASGPTGGHITRPSDNKEPRRIAIIQCVGSRDVGAGNDHCSAVCCMQAAKDAIITSEHLPNAQATIFSMDIRAYGKEFDKFIDRAKDEYKTRFIRSRISSVENDPLTDNLVVHYGNGKGNTKEEFDLVVISLGLEPTESSKELARNSGILTDHRGFIKLSPFSPVSSNKPGIFMCGSVSGPKDIPESVIEASGAASAATVFQNQNTIKDVTVEYPDEIDIRGTVPRVGVFICRCGINIASTVNVPEVVEYAKSVKGVAHAQELLFSCSQDSQKLIKQAIKDKNLNRLVVAACTPRTHEPLFQRTLKEAGINPYLFEFANIREQCSWVHQKEPEKATNKAMDLVRNAIGNVKLAEPLYQKELSVHKGALVIGGGIAGMTSALDLADSGYQVHLVEKEKVLGGNLRHVTHMLSGEETLPVLTEMEEKVMNHSGITLHTDSTIKEISGYVGNFKTTLQNSPEEIEHGVTIIATGGVENKPDEYLYNNEKKVVTQRELEEELEKSPSSALSGVKTIVMIQCVGSRDDDRPYCSRVCCSNAIKNAIRIKDLNPDINIFILFRDIRTYGLKERYYRLARSKKIMFLRYEKDEKPVVTKNGKRLEVKMKDLILHETLTFHPDLLVLSSGILPNPGNKELSQFLKVPLNGDGFFLEAHVKLKPVDFATEGVFVCGLAHYPKDISETIAQARAAAGRAATILHKDRIEAEGKVSGIRGERCNGCETCIKVCAYNALTMDVEKNIAKINEALCKGCGVCAATCRSGAIDLKGFKNEQILNALKIM
jgi:heterodisulfide reductase subunit A